MSYPQPSLPWDVSPPVRPIVGLPTAVQRPFALIAFDWDGTAVPDRRADASAVRGRVEQLLRLGVWVAVVTGTHTGNIEAQFAGAIRGPHKQRLIICANRGSEVFGFDAHGDPILRWRRVATPEEDRLLTTVAERVRDDLMARIHLPITIVYDRLNRRKIDLIPVPDWRDPPKAALGALLQAVQQRLRRAGLTGGLQEAFTLSQSVARMCGLHDARITSDVKHIEVGLTDKGDSVAWVLREIAAPAGIAPRDILLVGDELGNVGGLPGSDGRMLVPEARGTVVVSVGPEPEGVPVGVIRLGGGPWGFCALLDDQIARHHAMQV